MRANCRLWLALAAVAIAANGTHLEQAAHAWFGSPFVSLDDLRRVGREWPRFTHDFYEHLPSPPSEEAAPPFRATDELVQTIYMILHEPGYELDLSADECQLRYAPDVNQPQRWRQPDGWELVERCLIGLTDADARLRLHSIYELGRLHVLEAVGPLRIVRARDSSSMVQQAADQALGFLGCRSILGPIGVRSWCFDWRPYEPEVYLHETKASPLYLFDLVHESPSNKPSGPPRDSSGMHFFF
jgi:hypothetical protein